MNKVFASCRLLLVFAISLQFTYSSISQRQYILSENSPEGWLVADLVKDFELDIPESKLPSLNFSVTSKPQVFLKLESNGQLKCTHVPIDRELMCQNRRTCTLNIRAALVTPRELYRSFELNIDIIDENDNEPIFTPSEFVLNVPENADVNSAYNLPVAIDKDVDNNDIQEYIIDVENVIHSLNRSSDVDAPDFPFELVVKKVDNRMKHQVSLRVVHKLDRESVSFYKFKVKAIDGGRPLPKTGTLTVNVNVLDVNDNIPVFEKELYEVTVDENFTVGETIVTVTAQDADEGLNSEIRYELSPGQWEEEIFSVDEFTGDLILKKPLDHSESSEYSIEIMATDLGLDAVSIYANVKIHVRDTNNNAPQLFLNPLTDEGTAEVHENIPLGSFALHLSAKDADSGNNGRVNCSVSDPLHHINAFALEHIEDNEFKLVTTSDIDREVVQAYRLTILCKDFGDPVLSASADVLVKVLDVDDNPPFFEKNLYFTEVLENNDVDQFLLQVRADDLDSGISAPMRFSLCPQSQQDAGHLVTVEEQSGKILALKSFDYEILKEFRFCVMVDNECKECPSSLEVSTTATADVLVKIMDVNDNAPEFVRKVYRFEIPEKSPLSTEVGTLRAVDKDSEPFNSFVFNISTNSSESFPFHVDANSGKITTTAALDREDVAYYKFLSKAIDNNDARLESSVLVEIKILDINDNSPTFLPDCQNSKVNVGLVDAEVIEVCRFRALDPDEGNNGDVSYSLIREDIHKLFNISSRNGTLFLQVYNLLNAPETLFVNSTAALNITVLAKDNGHPQLSTILKTTADINLLQEFSMDSLRQMRDGYFAGRPLRILLLCGAVLGVLATVVGLVVFLIYCGAKKKKEAQALRPRCEVKIKSFPKDPDASDECAGESADEEEVLKTTNDNNSNNNKSIAIHATKAKSYEWDKRGQELKYDFSDGPYCSPLKKKCKSEINGNQFFSLTKKRKGSVSEKASDKKDVIYKPCNDLPKKQPIFFKPQISSDDAYSEARVSNRDLPSSHAAFNPNYLSRDANGRNVNVDIWNGSPYNQETPPNDSETSNLYKRGDSSAATNEDIYPYSKVSTFFEYHNGDSREKLKATPSNSDTFPDRRNIPC